MADTIVLFVFPGIAACFLIYAMILYFKAQCGSDEKQRVEDQRSANWLTLLEQVKRMQNEFDIVKVRQTTLEKKIIGASRTINFSLQSPIEIIHSTKKKEPLIRRAGLTPPKT